MLNVRGNKRLLCRHNLNNMSAFLSVLSVDFAKAACSFAFKKLKFFYKCTFRCACNRDDYFVV